MKTLNELEAELDRINLSLRWGETRRFHSNTRKIEHRDRLLARISAMRVAQKERLDREEREARAEDAHDDRPERIGS